MMPSKLMSEII